MVPKIVDYPHNWVIYIDILYPTPPPLKGGGGIYEDRLSNIVIV